MVRSRSTRCTASTDPHQSPAGGTAAVRTPSMATTLGAMPTLTRHRLPLVVLAVLFLIPIATSSLRGLTHILSCEDEVGTYLSITPPLEPGEPPTLLSSQVIEAGDDPLICEALEVELSIGDFDEDTGAVELVVAVANRSEADWRGTIQLDVGDTPIPVTVGRIPAGTSVDTSTWVRGRDDQVAIDGELLIGP